MTGQPDDLINTLTSPLISHPMDTTRCCDVESTSMTLIQRRINVVCPVGSVTVLDNTRCLPDNQKMLCYHHLIHSLAL